MKQGSEYAKRIRRLLTQLQKKFGKPEIVEGVDPTEQLIIGILAGCTTHSRAQTVYRKLRQHVVDLNELRVTPAIELAEEIGDAVPLARQKAQRIVDALNAVRRRQDSLDLTFLKQRGRREAREYLESLEGVDRAAAASVVLFSLGGHAIPLDGLMLYVLRREEYVDPSADAAEVQNFLERCINASQAALFYELFSRYAASRTVKVPYEQLEDLMRPGSASVPAPAGALAAAGTTSTAAASGAGSRSTAAASAAPSGHTAGAKSRKSRATAPRISETPASHDSNHNRTARPAAVRKKK